MMCPHCGQDIPDVSAFCLHCGKSTVPKNPKRISLATFIVSLVAVAALTASVLLVLRSPTRNDAASHPLENGQLVSAPAGLTANTSGSTAQAPHEFTTEELFKLASPGVVLVEVFGQSGEKSGVGSGFVAANDAIITNYHVIRGAYSARVHFQDSSTAMVQGVAGFDPERDVALIRVSDTSAKPLALGDSDRLQVGSRVVAIGSPLGLQNTMSDGLVSGLRNGLIQTSTPLSPGSSGGPLFNTHGEVVGVAVAGIVGAENLNFAAPVNWAKRYLRETALISLGDLSRQSTVSRDLLSSTVSVPAHQRMNWPFVVDRNTMASPELEGAFSSSGGMGGNIRVIVANEKGVVYDSGRAASGQIHERLQPGSYQLVLDNTGSMVFARSVTAEIKLRYVK